jgi:hypothetical protein
MDVFIFGIIREDYLKFDRERSIGLDINTWIMLEASIQGRIHGDNEV